MTTCCPRTCESLAASGRATVSVPPPGGNGTIIFTGLSGHPCASAGNAASTTDARARRARSDISFLRVGDDLPYPKQKGRLVSNEDFMREALALAREAAAAGEVPVGAVV